MLFTKLLAHRLFLLFITFIVTGIIGFLMVDELHILLNHTDRAALMELKEDEEGIAILIIGFGVLLEGRHILQNWIAGEEIEASHTTHLCEYYGFMLLAVGLIIEMVYQLVSLVDNHTLSYWVEVLVNYPLNVYTMYLMIKVMFVLFDPKSDTEAAH